MENKNTDNQNTNNNIENTTSTTTGVFAFGIILSFKIFLLVSLMVFIAYLALAMLFDFEFYVGVFFAVSVVATIFISFGVAICVFSPNCNVSFETSKKYPKPHGKFDPHNIAPLPGSSFDKFASSCDSLFDTNHDGKLDTFEQIMKNDFFWGDD